MREIQPTTAMTKTIVKIPIRPAKQVRINVSVPEDLHRAFKVKAVSLGESHQDIILRAIREYVDR